MKRDFDLMDNILDGIENADSRDEMMQKDQMIQATDNALLEALGKVRKIVPENVYLEIENAATSYASAIGDFNLLYGMHVLSTMLDFSRHPEEMSQYILDRVNNRQRAS